ncbi:Aerobic glycerol-3-phosphate dehydrogenase [Corynebacterium occultum]|uniref:Aerobic glycerol-3-phosphate dehydrogenase n=1 Tax=Corynebacterium occultum TaxID=2675219 RepID=A0A6B8W5Z1_9CORY|nr:glycerol-3-phosphate dehydrogenase/oxidase [Corynebacterium occultum]QGU08001.1 Aerobic glycerol-3-phosphate dehydrogenase [Corynebacterium occultum]
MASLGTGDFGDRVLGPAVHGEYDLAVIGGGISGVQIARHAAGHGLRTILLEREDYGSGTSSATTKAIHGGLRYLEQYDFGVVAESLAERRYLGIAAPHLVQPRSFLLAAYEWSAPKAPVLGAGVALYEAMAANRNFRVPKDIRSRRFRWVNKQELLAQVPWLQPQDLVGAWRHDDTLNLHPERLLLAILGSAISDGATAVNHAEVIALLREESGRVRGVEVLDRLGGGSHEIRAKVTVNAAGPWVESALGELAEVVGVKVKQSKGVHLLTRDLGSREGVYVRGRNGHHFMVNPWEGRTLIGPTDTLISGSADEAVTTPEDIELLLETFDSVAAEPLDRAAIEATLVGVRPLVDDGADTYTSSRRFEIFNHAESGVPGLFTVTGGKWTTARAMGEKVLEKVLKVEAENLPPTRKFDSRHLPVAGSFGDFGSLEAAFEAALQREPELGIPERNRLHLARLYGTGHGAVLELIRQDPGLAREISPANGCRDILAQVVYGVCEEGARTLRDVVDRRLTLGTLGLVSEAALRLVAEALRPLLGWRAEDTESQVGEYLRTQAAMRAVIESVG